MRCSLFVTLIAFAISVNCYDLNENDVHFDDERREAIPHWIEPLSRKMSDYINYMNTTWKAGENFEYGKIPLKHVKVRFCGL